MRQSGNYFTKTDIFGNTGNDFTITCHYCGKFLMDGEGYYQQNGKPYCEECVEGADLNDLIRICETNSDELYRSVGLQHGFVAGDL